MPEFVKERVGQGVEVGGQTETTQALHKQTVGVVVVGARYYDDVAIRVILKCAIFAILALNFKTMMY
jgi:hypothetical protein